MKSRNEQATSQSLLKPWPMGNACLHKASIPCFRVAPMPYDSSFELERKAYCIPWDGRETTVGKSRQPCCFCWCCFCTCAMKQSRVAAPASKTGTILEIVSQVPIEARLNAEKVKRWMFDFESLLTDEVGKGLFETFLRQEYSDENLRFWSDVERMKGVEECTVRYISIRKIYREYIQPRSVNEINIEAWIRKAIEDNLVRPPVDIYDTAQAQVYLLMYRQSWPRFLASSFYQNLLQNIQ